MNFLCRFELGAARLVVAVVALSCAADAWAQGPADGAVHGVVEDAARRPAAVELVTVENLETGEVRTGAVARDGGFLIAHLAPGPYAVTIPGHGLDTARYQPLVVSLAETTELRATLRAAPGVSSVEALAVAAAGPVAPALPDENDDGLASARGLATIENGATLDGMSMTQSFDAAPMGSGSDPAADPEGDSDAAERTTGSANGLARGRHAGAAYVYSEAAVREFRVSGENYSALTGNGAGEVVTTVSRAGTTALHGSGGYRLRSQAFAAANPLAIATTYANGVVTSAEVKPHDLREGFIGTLSGPVPRVRSLLFFYAFQGQLRGFPAVSSPGDPNFYRLTSTQSALLANRGLTGAQENAGLNYLSSLTGVTARRQDEALNFARADWVRHPRASLAMEYNGVRWSSPAGLMAAPVVARGRASIGNASGSLDSVLVRATSVLRTGMVNAAHAAFTRDLQYETPQTPLAQEPAISPDALTPEVNIGPDGLEFGTPATLSQVAYPDERRVELADTLSVVRGRHLMELGASVAFVHDFVATQANAAGTFRYDSGATGGYAGGLVDFLTDYAFNVNASPNGGCPSINAAAHYFCFRSYSQSFGVSSVGFSTEEWAGFAQDTWRVRRGLTVYAGARYEYTLLPLPINPNPTLDAIFGGTGATGRFPEDRNNAGPRVGVAWEPLGAGHGMIQLGYGIYFGRLPGATIRSALVDTAGGGGTTNIRITPQTITACPQATAQGFGYLCAFTTQPVGVAATTTSAMLFDRRFRLPAVQQGSVSIAGTVGRTTVSAGYVVNLDRQLASSTDLNIAASTGRETYQLQGGTGAPGVMDGEVFVLPLYTARVTPSFGPVTDILSNANATYHALVVNGESRARRGLELRAAYAWSKAIDYGQSQAATPRTNGQLDPFTNGYDKGLSSLNFPWAVRAAAIWAPEPQVRERWLEAAARGWQVVPIFNARAGRPYSYDLSGGTRLNGGHESLNGSGGALYLPTVGRNTLRLPATINLDLRLARGFRLGQKVELRSSVEAFNVLNHLNLSSVTQRAYLVGTAISGVTPLVFQSAAAIAAEGLNTLPFGAPTAASSSLVRERQVQLGVQVSF